MSFLRRLLEKLTRAPRHPPTGERKVPVFSGSYATWMCLSDEHSCEFCKSLDSLAWLPKAVRVPEPPHPSCRSPQGCRCVVCHVSSREAGARAVAALIAKAGGQATGAQMAELQTEKQARSHKKWEQERLAAEKAMEAGRLERDEPVQAVSLYREALALRLGIAKRTRDQWRWRDFPYLYDRLTMLLERLGRTPDALAEIRKYESLPCSDQGAKSHREAIQKRKKRLESAEHHE